MFGYPGKLLKLVKIARSLPSSYIKLLHAAKQIFGYLSFCVKLVKPVKIVNLSDTKSYIRAKIYLRLAYSCLRVHICMEEVAKSISPSRYV